MRTIQVKVKPGARVSALVEAWARKPTYQDFMRLRDDVGTLKGWYANRVSRTFLNFFLTCMGTIAGEAFAMLQKVNGPIEFVGPSAARDLAPVLVDDHHRAWP